MRHLTSILALLLAVGVAGCASPEETTRAERPTTEPATDVGGFSPEPTAPEVRTVQLYRTGAEASLPVINLDSGQTLTLEFDLLDDGLGGPVSVHFYHTDRYWNQRLMPVEYMRGFQTDDIRAYEQSASTRVRYTHYRYDFPNNVIEFTRSGNFIMRVTELGEDQAVLLERAFFISEGSAEVAITQGHGGVARVRPPAHFTSAIYEFSVCFAREGRFEVTRCSQNPTLVGASLYEFFLARPRVFEAPGPRYDLDLSILGAGPQIAAVDLSTIPYQVVLNTDDARFAAAFFDDDLLYGQPLVRSTVQDLISPETQAEYVETTFSLLPAEGERIPGRVLLTGSFNGWELNPANEMHWDEEAGLYHGTFLIKQGRYGYRYHVEDPAVQARRSIDIGRPTLYTALVYLHEPIYNTDRLLSVRSAVVQ